MQYYAERPDRLTKNKDKAYHLQFGKFVLGRASLWQQTYFVKKYLINMAFYKGNQWILNEDMDSFLMDESGDVRNRIQFVHNIIKPYVEYFRGSLVKMDLNFTVSSISRESINRREQDLDQLLYIQKAASEFGGQVGQNLYNQYPIAPTKQQTIESFNNSFIDYEAKTIKHLIQHVTERNDFEDIKVNLGEDLAFGGISIVKESDYNGNQNFRSIYPPSYFWDLTARKKNLKDAEWMGDFELRGAGEILEKYQNLTMDEKKMITEIQCTSIPGLHNITDFLYGYTGDKVPVYDIYWKDIENDTHGLVFDKHGYVCIVDLDKDEEYTVKDLIPEDQLKELAKKYKFIKTVFNYKNKRRVTVEYVRFCTFIPQLYSGTTDDIVLDYGVRAYTHKYQFQNPECEFPYAIGTYAYMDGEVISPLDSQISPQRYINRMMSMLESNVNNSRGSGTAVDMDAVAEEMTQEEVQSAMNRSKPIFLRAGGNVQNALGNYDNTIKAGSLTLLSVARDIKAIADEIQGGGDALRGAGGGYRVSGTAIDQNLNQAITLQEPFFYAIYKCIFECYNKIAGRGKRIYAANEREFAIMTGDEGYRMVQITKDYELLDFRLMLERAPSKTEQKLAANSQLLNYLQMQLIDDKTYSRYLNNCDVSDLPYILREAMTVKYEAIARQQVKEKRDQALDQVINSAALSEQNLMSQKNEALGAQMQDASNRTKIIGDQIRSQAKQQPQTPSQ